MRQTVGKHEFKRNKTCKDIIRILKLTDDIGLAYDMIENRLKGCKDWQDKVKKAINDYYKGLHLKGQEHFLECKEDLVVDDESRMRKLVHDFLAKREGNAWYAQK